MGRLREIVEEIYLRNRDEIFERTAHDPEIAHEHFVKFSKILHKTKLDSLLATEPANLGVGEISNAAGFNKNGDIHPEVMSTIGFHRNVIGTVTGDGWEGNPRPRIMRVPKTHSLINWMGLPGIGAEKVAENIASYGECWVPTTLNLMSTPGKTGDAMLEDLRKTIRLTKHFKIIDRYEINISCPNTHSVENVLDARKQYLAQLRNIIQVASEEIPFGRDIWLKVSPDLDQESIEYTIDTSSGTRIVGL